MSDELLDRWVEEQDMEAERMERALHQADLADVARHDAELEEIAQEEDMQEAIYGAEYGDDSLYNASRQRALGHAKQMNQGGETLLDAIQKAAWEEADLAPLDLLCAALRLHAEEWMRESSGWGRTVERYLQDRLKLALIAWMEERLLSGPSEGDAKGSEGSDPFA